MPDSEWGPVSHGDSTVYEQRHSNGQPPDGFRRHHREYTERTLLNGARMAEEVVVFVDWTAQPAPERMTEACNRCDGHDHDASAAIPEGEKEHARDGYWMERVGLLYRNVRIRGTELRRLRLIGYRPDGTLAFDIGPLWHRRTVDHVKNGIEWMAGGEDMPCIGGRPFTAYASLLEPGEAKGGAGRGEESV